MSVKDMDLSGVIVDEDSAIYAAVQRAVLQASEEDKSSTVEGLVGMVDVRTDVKMVVAILRQLEAQNKLMFDGDDVFFM